MFKLLCNKNITYYGKHEKLECLIFVILELNITYYGKHEKLGYKVFVVELKI